MRRTECRFRDPSEYGHGAGINKGFFGTREESLANYFLWPIPSSRRPLFAFLLKLFFKAPYAFWKLAGMMMIGYEQWRLMIDDR